MVFPDDFTDFGVDPDPDNTLAFETHAARHTAITDALKRLENTVGLTDDTDPLSHDYRIETLEVIAAGLGTASTADTGDFEAAGSIAAHEAASDPHTGYQKESEKNAANGYAGLSAGSKLTGSQQTYGSSANTACEGNDSRLSDSRAPTGSAGGVLSGTYPNPGFAVDMATQAELDAHTSATGSSVHGLGTLSTQAANNVSITGGSVTGITDITVADGGTGASTLAAHGVLVGNDTGAVAVTGTGTAGQVLTSNGASADPTFQDAAGGSSFKGPIAPFSAYAATQDRTFENIHTGAGANSKHSIGMGVEASVGANSIWRLRFPFPAGTLPSGTCKLRLHGIANATTGNAKINAKWASVAAEEAPDVATLQAEGTSTLSWSTGDNDQIKELLVTLDGDTPVAGEWCVMDLTFETSSWTLAAVSTWFAWLIWE